jgi:hypothetical protein
VLLAMPISSALRRDLIEMKNTVLMIQAFYNWWLFYCHLCWSWNNVPN